MKVKAHLPQVQIWKQLGKCSFTMDWSPLVLWKIRVVEDDITWEHLIQFSSSLLASLLTGFHSGLPSCFDVLVSRLLFHLSSLLRKLPCPALPTVGRSNRKQTNDQLIRETFTGRNSNRLSKALRVLWFLNSAEVNTCRIRTDYNNCLHTPALAWLSVFCTAVSSAVPLGRSSHKFYYKNLLRKLAGLSVLTDMTTAVIAVFIDKIKSQNIFLYWISVCVCWVHRDN